MILLLLTSVARVGDVAVLFLAVLAVAQAAHVGILVEQEAHAGQIVDVLAHGVGDGFIPQAAHVSPAVAVLWPEHVPGALPAVDADAAGRPSLMSG